jgi:hypothetical protein
MTLDNLRPSLQAIIRQWRERLASMTPAEREADRLAGEAWCRSLPPLPPIPQQPGEVVAVFVGRPPPDRPADD